MEDKFCPKRAKETFGEAPAEVPVMLTREEVEWLLREMFFVRRSDVANDVAAKLIKAKEAFGK